jgi:hypothetical protein
MRRNAMAAVLAALMMMVFAGSALADVAGTSEGTDPGTGRGTNQVSCGAGTAAAGPVVVSTEGDPAAASGAVVVCNQSSDLPIQGRVIGSGSSSGGYVAADGDADNPEEKSQGYARVDIDGGGPRVTCGDPAGDLNAETPGATDSQDQCG